MQEDLLAFDSDIVDRARRYGADEADAYVGSSTESSVRVRKGKVERVIDAGSRAASVRVIKNKCTAICSTEEITPKALYMSRRRFIGTAAAGAAALAPLLASAPAAAAKLEGVVKGPFGTDEEPTDADDVTS